MCLTPVPFRLRQVWTVFILSGVLILPLAIVGCGQGTGTLGAVAQPSPTATASATPTPVIGTMRVSDPAVAAELSFAFVRDNDVWVSWQGNAPRQLTHFGLGNQSLDWGLIWSPDHTKLLAVAAASPITAATARGWILAMPGGAATALPSGANVSLGCLTACTWMVDRYIAYFNDAANPPPRFTYLKLYDTQTQRDLSTALDTIGIPEHQYQPIGTDIYFADFRHASSSGLQTYLGVISRFDLASNTITTAFTVPGPAIEQAIPDGGFDLSADGSKIVAWGTSTDCPSAHCAFYQDRPGPVIPILPAPGARGASYIPASISPDGAHVATFVDDSSGTTSQIVQQALPSGHELTNTIPVVAGAAGYGEASILGWTQKYIVITASIDQYAGISSVSSPTGIFVAPLGSSQAAHLVETVQGPPTYREPLVFAPVGG